ncbi:MAG: hypothetical protein JST54_27895 [Deltaproteobacteria bacterium]|nr:hypothetical protein [Deltaproteobacteria bacterium]
MRQSEANNHWIESWILRAGRWFCTVIGALAIASLVLGSVALVVAAGYFLLAHPTKPALPPEPPAAAPVSIEDAKRLVKAELAFSDAPGQRVPELSEEDIARATPLRELFPTTNYTWDDVLEDYCHTPTSYGCLERGQRVTRRGVGRFIAYVLTLVDEDEREHSISELKRLLPGVAAAERANLVIPILSAERDRSIAAKKQQDAHQEQVAQIERAYNEAVSDHRSTAGFIAMLGAGGVASGVSAMLSICLVVAILAIERHLRTATTAVEARPATWSGGPVT